MEMQYDEMIVYYLPFADLPNRFWRICPTVLTTLPHRFCRFAPSFLTHLPHFSFFVLIAQIWRQNWSWGCRTWFRWWWPTWKKTRWPTLWPTWRKTRWPTWWPTWRVGVGGCADNGAGWGCCGGDGCHWGGGGHTSALGWRRGGWQGGRGDGLGRIFLSPFNVLIWRDNWSWGEPLRCIWCDQKIADNNNLRLHMMSHSGEKKTINCYHCDFI